VKFAKAWERAVEDAVDVLRAEAFRRAVQGVEEPVFHRGREIAVVRKYSDQLLGLLLRAHAPEHNPVEKHEITGRGGGPIEQAVFVIHDNGRGDMEPPSGGG